MFENESNKVRQGILSQDAQFRYFVIILLAAIVIICLIFCD